MPGFSNQFPKVAFLVLALISLAHLNAWSHERLIRVGIVPQADSFVFTVQGHYQTLDFLGRPKNLVDGKTHTVKPSAKLLSLGRWTLPAKAWLKSQDPRSALWIGGRRYPGDFLVLLNPNKTVTGIEIIGIETYLLGVVGHEMDASWPLEALKAQAVVARTFAYFQLEQSHPHGYDLGDDAGSQVYGGVNQTPKNIILAVHETKGEVLGYQGKLLSVYYHSCCGGHTADAGWVWGFKNTPRPLRGVRDPYCKFSPYYRWKVFFRSDEIKAALESRRLIGGALKFFKIGSRKYDYAKNFKAQIGDTPLSVDANRFRLALGASSLKSVRIFSIKREAGGIEFSGGGSGHGVGLCQWGARGQAMRGRSYEKILKFYFHGSVLSVVE